MTVHIVGKKLGNHDKFHDTHEMTEDTSHDQPYIESETDSDELGFYDAHKTRLYIEEDQVETVSEGFNLPGLRGTYEMTTDLYQTTSDHPENVAGKVILGLREIVFIKTFLAIQIK